MTLQQFVSSKKDQTVKLFIVGFQLYEGNTQIIGSIKLNKYLLESLNLRNHKCYDIYLKLKVPVADCYTRNIFTNIVET